MTWPMVSRHESRKGAEVESQQTFMCRDMGQATQCPDTVLGVTTWVGLLGLRPEIGAATWVSLLGLRPEIGVAIG